MNEIPCIAREECYLLYSVFPFSDAISVSCIFLFCPFSYLSAHPVLHFTFLHFLFLLISVSLFNALSYYICSFLCASFEKTTFNVCLRLSYIVHYIPTSCILSLFVHPIFSCILYSFCFCFLCILSVFIPYCIFFNLRIFILSFFVHFQIIFLKFSVHILGIFFCTISLQ